MSRAVLALALACGFYVTTSGYALSGFRWPMTEIPYYVNPTNLDVSTPAALAAVQWAADAWSSQTDATVRLVYAGLSDAQAPSKNGRNEVMFRNVVSPVGNVGGAFRYVNSQNEMIEADLVFYDGGYRFFSAADGNCSSGHYIEGIGIHEFGHILGLNHSAVSTATMKAGATRCSTAKMSLDQDDIEAIETLYPPTIPSPEPDPDPEESGSLTLTTKPPKVTVAIFWSGASGSSVDVYLDGVLYGTTPNDGAQSLTLKGPGPWLVKVCEAGTGICTPVTSVAVQ